MRAQGVQGQGCPQHESTQPGPLTLCCLIRRGSGIKTGTGPNSQQNEFKRSPLQNVSKDDFPMASVPDPTTAASERSPAKKNSHGPAKKRRCGNLHVPSSMY